MDEEHPMVRIPGPAHTGIKPAPMPFTPITSSNHVTPEPPKQQPGTGTSGFTFKKNTNQAKKTLN